MTERTAGVLPSRLHAGADFYGARHVYSLGLKREGAHRLTTLAAHLQKPEVRRKLDQLRLKYQMADTQGRSPDEIAALRLSGMVDFKMIAEFESHQNGYVLDIPPDIGQGCLELKIPLTVISANGALEYTQLEAIEEPQRAIIYVGGSTPNQRAIDARDYIAMYFAREHGHFADQLEQEGALYFPYSSWQDIDDKLYDFAIKVELTAQKLKQVA